VAKKSTNRGVTLLKDRFDWVPKALRDGSEMGDAAAKAAEEFLLVASFSGIAKASEGFRHLGDPALAEYLKNKIEAGLASRAAGDNPGLDAALLLAAGVRAISIEIANLVAMGNHPQSHLVLGDKLWATAESFARERNKAHATSCPDLVDLLRPAYHGWLLDRDDMVTLEREFDGVVRSYDGQQMDLTVGGFFRGLETNRPAGIVRSLVWGGIISMRGIDANTPPVGRGPAVWVNGTLAIAATLGGGRHRNTQDRTCHYLLDENVSTDTPCPACGVFETSVGLAASVFALSCVASPATKAEDRYVVPAHGFGADRSNMVYSVAQMLNGVPLGALNMTLVGQGFQAGDDFLRLLPGYAALGIMERRKVSPWRNGAVHRAFACGTWAKAELSGAGA
jgi:hypothetical protein